MHTLLTAIEKHAPLTPALWEQLAVCWVKGSAAAGQTLASPGDSHSFLYFIETGIVRGYHLADGEEITTYFAADNEFISIFSALNGVINEHQYLQAVTDTVFYKISREKLESLYRSGHVFEHFGRILAVQNYLCISERSISFQQLGAAQRYALFLNRYSPQIVNEVPQKFIASYLGIAPESLSRIRHSKTK